MPARKLPREPQIVELPCQTMAVVQTKGDPNNVGPKVIPVLYGAVYTYKFDQKKHGHDFKVGALRARWSGATVDQDGGYTLGDPSEMVGEWALPVPDGTTELPQKSSDVEVNARTWEYGPVAQVLHEGPYSEEPGTVQRLHAFVAASGYEIVGPHEEEYLTRPGAKVQKTLIRYRVRPKST